MDNSDWTRNGDYHPSRWDSEVEASNLIAESKSEKNPENTIGLITMAGKRVEVQVSLTNDLTRILNANKNIHLSGESDFITSLNIATLTLKYRQNKNQKQRVIMFVGSPIKHSSEEIIQLGKKLKKYNIAIDIISFGNVDDNRELLNQLLTQVNNANNSSILEVPVGFFIMDSLFTSPIMTDSYDMPQDNSNIGGQSNNIQSSSNAGTGNQNVGMSQFERDMNLAIQNSLDEDAKRAAEAANKNEKTTKVVQEGQSEAIKTEDVVMQGEEEESEESLLEQAKLLSIEEHKNNENKKLQDLSKIYLKKLIRL